MRYPPAMTYQAGTKPVRWGREKRREEMPYPPGLRWVQLVFGIICMVMIANLQYGWTLFVLPIDQKYIGAAPRYRWRSASSC